MGRSKVRLTVQENDLDDLAAIDEVRHIQEVPRGQAVQQRRAADPRTPTSW